MRVVTIAATHESFVHPMFEGHRKVASHVPMAAVAEFRFGFREEEPWRARLVNGMALCARYIVQCVLRVADIRARQRVLMTPETGIGGLLRR